MNITINTGAALDDAAQIDTIVRDIEADLEGLNSVITDIIPNKLQTDWSDEVRGNWDQYYSSDIPEAMEAMTLSATNLRLAVNEALRYSREQ